MGYSPKIFVDIEYVYRQAGENIYGQMLLNRTETEESTGQQNVVNNTIDKILPAEEVEVQEEKTINNDGKQMSAEEKYKQDKERQKKQ